MTNYWWDHVQCRRVKGIGFLGGKTITIESWDFSQKKSYFAYTASLTNWQDLPSEDRCNEQADWSHQLEADIRSYQYY